MNDFITKVTNELGFVSNHAMVEPITMAELDAMESHMATVQRYINEQKVILRRAKVAAINAAYKGKPIDA